jgi:hypothetical protein
MARNKNTENKNKEKEKQLALELETDKKEVDAGLEKLKTDHPDCHKTLMRDEEEVKKLYTSDQEAKVKRNPLLLGKLFAEMRVALYGGVDKDYNANSPEGKLLGSYQRVRMNPTETGVSRASIFRYDKSYRNAADRFGEDVVIAMANDRRMIGVQISPENPLGRFTDAAEKNKKKLDAKKPQTLDDVLNAKKPVAESRTRTADDEKEAFHESALKYVMSIVRKEGKPKDVASARIIVLESVKHLLLAVGLKGEQKIEASAAFPNDVYQTWEQFTKTETPMKKTERFGTYYGRLNPKNPHAGSTPWELINDADPKNLKVVGYARNEQDAANDAKKLFEKDEAAKEAANVARAAKKPKPKANDAAKAKADEAAKAKGASAGA